MAAGRRAQKKWSETLAALSRHGNTCRDATAPGDEKYRTDAERSRALTTSMDRLHEDFEAFYPLLTEIEEAARPALGRGDV
ncbi:hypothetical protein [Streptomyces afghaniensis]|uniref:hypothetical protein n=1 Tax=Streptomyces afghaniensis TaxID=66865 RepID=UPI002789C19F|nr:hypothetical protein [Streptomyces afghaniensis]MDQ1021637.1 hypothetical protein [Streptomyces afghaniensis]